MDGARSTNTAAAPEQLLDVFKAAALSVTKMYKTAATAQAKARAEGYQDCLDDLLGFLDRENMGISDGEGWRVRRWATGRLEPREATLTQGVESDDESDSPNKPEPMVSPEASRNQNNQHLIRPDAPMRTEPTPAMATIPVGDVMPATITTTTGTLLASAGPIQLTVPSQDTFTFQSPHPYPNIADLDLSDSRAATSVNPMNSPSTRPNRTRFNGSRSIRGSNNLGRSAGSKRKLNLGEIFDLGSLGGKDMFGNSSKRSRHA